MAQSVVPMTCVPLNAMCSDMCAMPVCPFGSWAAPTSAWVANENTGAPGRSQMMNVHPFGSTCTVVRFSKSARFCAEVSATQPGAASSTPASRLVAPKRQRREGGRIGERIRDIPELYVPAGWPWLGCAAGSTPARHSLSTGADGLAGERRRHSVGLDAQGMRRQTRCVCGARDCPAGAPRYGTRVTLSPAFCSCATMPVGPA